MSLKNIESIVVHPGGAHQDDLMSVALALGAITFKEGMSAPIVSIYRREPTTEELQDPNILILDVGGVYDTSLSNYDHHQMSTDDPENAQCAFSLFAGMLFRGRSLPPWVRDLAIKDHCGPYVWAKYTGNAVPQNSPLEGALLALFAEEQEIHSYWSLYHTLCDLGIQLYTQLSSWNNDMEWISQEVRVHDGFMVLHSELTPQQNQVLAQLREEKYPHIFGVLSHDDRGDGWTIYRYNDHPSLDFSKLEGMNGIVFAHKGGFIAKTELMSLQQALDLAKMGQVKENSNA